MLSSQQARRSGPPSFTNSIARPSTYSSVPRETATLSPHSSTMGTSPFPSRVQNPFEITYHLLEGFDGSAGASRVSDMSARQQARRSLPPSFTNSIARPITYSSVPKETPTTLSPHSSTMGTSPRSKIETSSAVEACALSVVLILVVPRPSRF